MIKIRIIIILCIFLFSCQKDEKDFTNTNLSEFELVLDESTYLGTSDKTVLETDDGGIIAIGYHYKDWLTENAQKNLYVVKIDSKGNVIWENSFGEEGSDYGKCIEKTDDGFLLLGTKTVNGNVHKNPFLIKIDKNGNDKWQKTYSFISNYAYGSYIINTSDNEFLICGTTTVNNIDKPYLLKIDEKGENIWYNEYDLYNKNLLGIKVLECKDSNGFIILTQKGFVYGNYTSIIFKTDIDGNLMWQEEFFDKSYFSFDYNGQDYIFVGQDKNTRETVFSLINSNGQEILSKLYSFGKFYDGVARSIRRDFDGNYIVTGRTDYEVFVNSPNFYDFYTDFGLLLTKIDTKCDTMWSKIFKNDNYVSYGLSSYVKKGGGYIIGGVSGNTIDPILSNSIYLLSTDSDGNITE